MNCWKFRSTHIIDDFLHYDAQAIVVINGSFTIKKKQNYIELNWYGTKDYKKLDEIVDLKVGHVFSLKLYNMLIVKKKPKKSKNEPKGCPEWENKIMITQV